MNISLSGLGASLLLASSFAFAGEWINDPVNGCSVWSDEPTDGHNVVSWSGDCEKGKASGHGVLSWFAEGEFVDGVLQGWGSWKVPS